MTLKSRIQKVELIVKQSASGAVLLREPANGDDRMPFDTAIAQAIEAGHQVIVLATVEPTRRISGVIYAANEFEAQLALAANTPATDGHSKDRLAQIIRESQGSSLPVVKTVTR